MILFHTPAYAELGKKLATQNGYQVGETEHQTFPDGERYIRIKTKVLDQEVFLLGGSYSDVATMELYDMGCGLVKLGAKRLHMVIPYFGYSTMERAIKPGEIVTAKNRARLFSSIPQAAYGNRFYAVDLHTGGLPYYFEGASSVFHVYAKDIIIQAARDLGGTDFVLASTDAGRAKWVESLANDIGVRASFVYKRRLSGSETMVRSINAQVEGAFVIIYDDMIRTGGSLIGAAKAYLDAGAERIAVIATHGVFPQGAIGRIRNSNLIDKIVTTDSHPRALQMRDQYPDYVQIYSLDAPLSKVLQNT